MNTWQKYWLYGVVVFFSLHFLRDVLQDLGIHTLISDIFVKADQSSTPKWYWQIFNTYIISAVELIIASYCLIRRTFKVWGYVTILIALVLFIAWLNYWFRF